MDIYSRPGTKVKFLNKHGHDYQRKEAQEIFNMNEEYTVTGVKAGSFSSCVTFEEVSGAFNTVMFKNIEASRLEALEIENKVLKADMELKDESIDELRAERAYMTQENFSEKARNRSLTTEIEWLREFEIKTKHEKQQKKQEAFMNPPMYTFEVETCNESVSFIVGYDGVGEHAEDSHADNIVFVGACEGFSENDWIKEKVEEDYKWQKKQKRLNSEGGG